MSRVLRAVLGAVGVVVDRGVTGGVGARVPRVVRLQAHLFMGDRHGDLLLLRHLVFAQPQALVRPGGSIRVAPPVGRIRILRSVGSILFVRVVVVIFVAQAVVAVQLVFSPRGQRFV